MKIRTDHITNSSSSSFIISKRHLSEEQIEKINNHAIEGEKLNMDYTEYSWDISEDEDTIEGSTYMDNFDMYDFLKAIDVDTDKVKWR